MLRKGGGIRVCFTNLPAAQDADIISIKFRGCVI